MEHREGRRPVTTTGDDGVFVTVGIDPAGPLFVSYRHSDGTTTAVAMAWLLRAAGVPVWLDEADLWLGDTNRRLEQALITGLSGGVLVVTPDVAHSTVIRRVEVPRLLELEADPAFLLAVANTIGHSGRPDYGAPDRLLGLPPGTAGRLNQADASGRAGLVEIVRGALAHRAAAAQETVTGRGGVLILSVQTRETPHAFTPDGADLSIRLRPGVQGRLPARSGLLDAQSVFPLLPQAVALSGAKSVRIIGGAHLSVALALGATLPATLVGAVEAVDTAGQAWTSSTVSGPSGTALVGAVGHGTGSIVAPGSATRVLVYVDLLPARSDAAYRDLLGQHTDQFAEWTHLRPVSGMPLDPGQATALVTDVAHRIRMLSGLNDNAEVHLLLRCPYPVAVLLGRLLNTVRVVVYEWDDSDGAVGNSPPAYHPVLGLQPAASSGAISAVLLPDPEARTALAPTASTGGTP